LISVEEARRREEQNLHVIDRGRDASNRATSLDVASEVSSLNTSIAEIERAILVFKRAPSIFEESDEGSKAYFDGKTSRYDTSALSIDREVSLAVILSPDAAGQVSRQLAMLARTSHRKTIPGGYNTSI
jgi:hypothetical protein